MHRVVIKHEMSSVLNISEQSSGLSLNSKKSIDIVIDKKKKVFACRQLCPLDSIKPAYDRCRPDGQLS